MWRAAALVARGARPPGALRAPSGPPLLRGMAHVGRDAARRVFPQWKETPALHELDRPKSWLGAYYSLREGDEAAARNREKLKGKRARSRGKFIVNAFEQLDIDKAVAAEPFRATDNYAAGDVLQVEHCAAAGEPAQTAVGMMIAVHRKGLAASIRLLCKLDGCPVEYQFQLHSPLLLNVRLLQPSRWRNRQRKLYHMRERIKELPNATPLKPGDPGLPFDTRRTTPHYKRLPGSAPQRRAQAGIVGPAEGA